MAEPPDRADARSADTAGSPAAAATKHDAAGAKKPTNAVRNRRLTYLMRRHDEYFTSNLSDANPGLYDKLVRQHMSAREREAEIQTKGWSGKIWEDLQRAEERLQQAHEPRPPSETDEEVFYDGDELSKSAARELWERIMGQRFLAGHDTDFDYAAVDDSSEWDDMDQIGRDAQDSYFDDEPADAGAALVGQTGIQDY
ncbi:coiled-coil domain-containing protein-domain-containing protein [Dipodascopsis tothii]|uniref:coiled-coil domain-containing protein-domain-containing protein n=1 Tax=Dipodascopsis tothii TaxID=44089 RepID=UPI0034CD9E37